LEAFDGFLVVAFAGGQVVVVVTYFMAQGCNLFDDGFVAGFIENAKVISALYAKLVLYLSHTQGVGVAGFDVVS
jgi:hypothetical protein